MRFEKQFLQIKNSVSSLDQVKILLVEDEPDTRMLFAFILENCGAEVVAVASAKEALEAIQQIPFHLLISDIAMPDEDGYSLIRKVRSLDVEQGRQIPAIAVTGIYEEELNYSNASTTEFQLHLTKPVDPNELVTAAIIWAKQEVSV